jgi:hypothetical protein
VKSQLIFNSVSLIAAASRVMVGNEEHMVVPVIAIREGVLNNIFYSADVIKANAAEWNGVPLPVSHPKDKDGNFITANSPEVEAEHNVGRLFNVNFDDRSKALKADLYIHIEKATKLGHKEMLERLDAGENMDVSTGLWTNATPQSGEYAGKSYEYVAPSILPDHLALLPNEIGACSTKDGCGTFILNAEKKPCCGKCAGKHNHQEEAKEQSMFGRAFASVRKALGFEANEVSHNELHRKLRIALDGKFKDAKTWQYVVDVFDNFFVYEQDENLFKQEYKLDKADSVELVGDATQVIIKKHYEEVAAKLATNTTKETNVKSPAVIASLAALLAANTITKESHDSFLALPDEALDAILKANGATPAPATPAAAPAATTGIPDGHTVIANADLEILREVKADREASITQMRAHIKANCKQIPAGVVDTMSFAQLKETAAGLSVNSSPGADYSFAAGAPGITTNADQGEAYEHPSVLLATATA